MTAYAISCFKCCEPHDTGEFQTVCRSCRMPLRVEVDMPAQSPDEMIDQPVESMWRYWRVLPVDLQSSVSMGEGWTPMTDLGDGLFVKDESVNPTGSFKVRGMSMAVSAARRLGADRLVAPTAGNAGLALAAYGAEADIDVFVSMPRDTPQRVTDRCRELGAEVALVDGDISVAGRWLADNRRPTDFDVSTLKEPFRVEGKKTMGYEIWEQLSRSLPEFVVYPTGGGTGLVGMWKAWDEMEAMGWIGQERPRLVSVQAAGCAPIVKAYDKRDDDIEPWPDPATSAWGLRVPGPIGGFLCLSALYDTNGVAVAIEEEEIHRSAAEATSRTGIDFCPEGGAAWAAAGWLREKGYLSDGARVVIFNTAAGENYRPAGR